MQRIAGGGDPRLRQQHLVVADGEIADGIAGGGHRPEMSGGDFAAGHRHLHDDADQRLVEAKPGHRADHAFASDGRGLDRLAVAQHREQRQHAAMREIDLVDFVAGFGQHVPCCSGDRRQMRQQPVEIIARQGGKQFVVQGKAGV